MDILSICFECGFDVFFGVGSGVGSGAGACSTTGAGSVAS
jgi:hypothetical protein